MKRILLVLAILAVVAAPAMATTYYDGFSYADGALGGNDGWSSAAATVTVASGAAKLTYDNTYRGLTDNVSFGPISGGTIWWSVDVFSGGTAYGSNAFDIRLEDAAGNAFARWYGGAYWERPRTGDTGQVLGNAILTEGVWNHLLVTIDTVTKNATYALNGTALGTLNYGAVSTAATAGRVRMGFQNATTAMNGAVKYYDNLRVSSDSVPEPASILALFSGLVGIVGFARRRK